MKRLALSFLLFLSFGLSAKAFSLWSWFKPKTIISEHEFQQLDLAKSKEDFRFAFVSDIFLYPVPTGGEDFPPPPKSKIGIMYQESQVLLQELIRELLKRSETEKLNFVIFGGSQVANRRHYGLFQDIAFDLQKAGLSFFEMLGYGETIGNEQINLEKNFYSLEYPQASFIVLDNVSEKPIPENLPEEASEQYIWLKDQLSSLEKSAKETYIFSYYPLSTKTRDFIREFNDLKLVMLLHSSKHNFSFSEDQGYIELSNPAFSVYPLSYSIIERSKEGKITIKQISSSLEGIKRKAKKARS